MKLRELTLNEMAATGGGASLGGPSGPSGPPSAASTLASTARVGARPPGGGHGLSQQGDLAVGKGGIFLGHQQAQEPHNYDADAQVGQGLEWPKAAGASETTDVKRDEVEMPGEHHVAGHHDDSHGDGVSESTLKEFAPGPGDSGDSGRWYSDDELADIIGDDWFEEFDVSNDGFNIDTRGEKAKQNLVGYANSWFDDRGYNVNVIGVEHNDVDHDLKWYIVGSFHNDNFAKKDLEEFSNGHGRDDDNGEDPYKYPKPESYRRSIDFFGRFEADHFDREDMNDATGEFKGYWGKTQIAYFKFDNPAKTGSDDPGMGWYYEPNDISDDDSNTNATPAVDTSAQRKQQELGMIDAFLKSGQPVKPGSQIYSLMKKHGLAEGNVMEDEGGASPGATTSADIAVVAYPMTRGRSRRARRRAARAAVGQKYTPGPAYIGQGVFESSLATMRDYFAGNTDAKDPTKLTTMRDYFSKIDKDIPETIQRIVWKVKNNVSLSPHEFGQYKEWMNNRRNTKIAKEAHVLDHKNVIYRLDRDKPMTDTEVLVLGGAGRYTLGGLRDKARREADAMAADLKVEHGGSFRRAAENIKQLTNTLNTIVAAYNELKRIRSKGGRGSRGITDEESNFMRECSQRMTTLELYTHRVKQAQRIVEGIHHYLKEDKMNPEQASIIKGMFHLNTDPGYGFYRYAIHVAGNRGGDKVVLGPNAGPFAYAYTDEENKMIRDAVKAITGKEPVELTGSKSKEPDFVNKNSTVPSIDWKKVK